MSEDRSDSTRKTGRRASQGDLTRGPVRRRLFDLWLPMVGGVFAIKAIGLADAYFVGQLGESALAAISFTFPVVMTVISLAIGLSAGAASVLSRAIGEGAGRRRQKAIVGGALVMAVGLAILIGVAGYLLAEPLVRLLGGRDGELAMATAYLQIWFGGAVFLLVPIATNGLLRSAGDGVSPALLLAGTSAVNIAVNPLMIFGVAGVDGLGVQGAAVATLVARGLAMVAAVTLLVRKEMLELDRERIREGLGYWREVARVGGPASLSTSLNPVALSIATAAVATLGTAEVAAFGVVTKIQSFAIVPLLALSSASSPLVGQNSGAGERERSRRALFWCGGISLAWALTLAVAFALGAPKLAGIFTESRAVRENVVLYLSIVPASYAGFGITVALSAALNGLGRSVEALMVSGSRAMILLAPAAWIGVLVDGFRGLAWGTVLANVLAAVIAFTVVWRHSLAARSNGGVQLDCAEGD